jgi:hypothetical protein
MRKHRTRGDNHSAGHFRIAAGQDAMVVVKQSGKIVLPHLQTNKSFFAGG